MISIMFMLHQDSVVQSFCKSMRLMTSGSRRSHASLYSERARPIALSLCIDILCIQAFTGWYNQSVVSVMISSSIKSVAPCYIMRDSAGSNGMLMVCVKIFFIVRHLCIGQHSQFAVGITIGSSRGGSLPSCFHMRGQHQRQPGCTWIFPAFIYQHTHHGCMVNITKRRWDSGTYEPFFTNGIGVMCRYGIF